MRTSYLASSDRNARLAAGGVAPRLAAVPLVDPILANKASKQARGSQRRLELSQTWPDLPGAGAQLQSLVAGWLAGQKNHHRLPLWKGLAKCPARTQRKGAFFTCTCTWSSSSSSHPGAAIERSPWLSTRRGSLPRLA